MSNISKVRETLETLQEYIEWEFEVEVDETMEPTLKKLARQIADQSDPEEDEEEEDLTFGGEESLEEPFGDMDDIADED